MSKYKLTFKATDTGLDADTLKMVDLSDSVLEKLVESLWKEKYKKQFAKGISFVETEIGYRTKNDGSWSYDFWIGDLLLTQGEYESWGQQILLEYRQELNVYLLSKGLNVIITQDQFYPDDAGYNGRGYVVFGLQSLPLNQKYSHILDFYMKRFDVVDYGIDSSLFYVEFEIEKEMYRVYAGLVARTLYKQKIVNSRKSFVPFTKEELKFFDSLDFQFTPTFAQVTGQDITDWFSEV